jgi:hypothetical protein
MLVNSCRINKLLSTPPSEGESPPPVAPGTPLQVTPATLRDSALIGTKEQRLSTIQVTNHGSWSAAGDSAWIKVSPQTGRGPEIVSIVLDSDGLKPGSHRGTVTVQAPEAIGSPIDVPVTFVIQQPVLEVRPGSLSHTTESSKAQFFDTLDVRNEGNGPLVWTASNRSSWLTITTIAGDRPGKLALTMSSAGLRIGTYRDTVVIVAAGAAGSPVRIPVTLRRKRD